MAGSPAIQRLLAVGPAGLGPPPIISYSSRPSGRRSPPPAATLETDDRVGWIRCQGGIQIRETTHV